MKEKELEGFIAKGHLLCRVIFEMAGNPKDHVEATLKQYITLVKEDPAYIFLSEEYAPCEETNDGIWSTFLEAEILVENFEKLNNLCFNLSPASVEIIRPEAFNLGQKKLTDWYNDLIAKIHEVGTTAKNMTSENDLLKININRLIRNCITLTVSEPKTIDEISLKAGIDKEHLQPFIDAMIKEKSLRQENGKYLLNK